MNLLEEAWEGCKVGACVGIALGVSVAVLIGITELCGVNITED